MAKKGSSEQRAEVRASKRSRANAKEAQSCVGDNGACAKPVAGSAEMRQNHLNVHALAFGWMTLAEFKGQLRADPDFNKQVEAALRVALGLEEKNFFAGDVTVDCVHGVRALRRPKGLTAKRCTEVFGRTPQQCGKVIRDLDDGKGGKFKGVCVEDESEPDVLYEVFTTTFKQRQQHKQMADGQLHPSQAQTIFTKVKLDEFMDCSPYQKAASMGDVRQKAALKGSPVASEAMALVQAKMNTTSIADCMQSNTGRSMGGADVLTEKLRKMGATIEQKIRGGHEEQYAAAQQIKNLQIATVGRSELDACLSKLRGVEFPERFQRALLERAVLDLVGQPEFDVDKFFCIVNPLSPHELTFDPMLPTLSAIAMSQEEKARFFSDKLIARYLLKLIEEDEPNKSDAEKFVLYAIQWFDDKIDDADVSICPEAAKQRGMKHSMPGLDFAALKGNEWYNKHYTRFMDDIVGFEKWGDTIHLRTQQIVRQNSTRLDPHATLQGLGQRKGDLDASVRRPCADSIENWLLSKFNFGDMQVRAEGMCTPSKQKASKEILLQQIGPAKTCPPSNEVALEEFKAAAEGLRGTSHNGAVLEQ
ncbi:unnamed protein product, partial [Prorocentrum cordatum]